MKKIILIFYILFLNNIVSSDWSFKSIWNGAKCSIGQCCNEDYIPGDITALHHELKEKLYGQHLAIQTTIASLKDHWDSKHSQKALTLSFHGCPGSGKNYLTKFIKKHLFHESVNHKYVHNFNGRTHFPLENQVDVYKDNLRHWVRGNTSTCGKQLFIFDEVDKMPVGVLDTIKPMIDYNEFVDGVDYRKAIFIFLSNTGAGNISGAVLNLWEQGIKREDFKLSHFEHLIKMGAFNEKGGFQYSDNIRSNLIDHYIPFLPMEESHLRLCIIDEFNKRNAKPEASIIEEVLATIEWAPEEHKLFSKTGCKRLSQKVGMLIHSHNLRLRHTEL